MFETKPMIFIRFPTHTGLSYVVSSKVERQQGGGPSHLPLVRQHVRQRW
jgi:hypothetical protein